MKKTLLIMFGFFLAHCAATGQNSVIVNEQSLHGNTRKTIIKQKDYPETITCVNSENDVVTFILSR